MPRFSARSRRRLETCHPALQVLFREVVQHFDCKVIEGHRGEWRQREMLRTGRSQLDWPDSLHNRMPAEAIDVIPHPLQRWDDWHRFHHFAGYVRGTADQLGIKIRSGLDWDGDFDLDDQTFNALREFVQNEMDAERVPRNPPDWPTDPGRPDGGGEPPRS